MKAGVRLDLLKVFECVAEDLLEVGFSLSGLLAERFCGFFGGELCGSPAGTVLSMGAEAAGDGFLDGGTGQDGTLEPDEDGSRILRALAGLFGDEPCDEVLECDVTCWYLRCGLRAPGNRCHLSRLVVGRVSQR